MTSTAVPFEEDHLCSRENGVFGNYRYVALASVESSLKRAAGP